MQRTWMAAVLVMACRTTVAPTTTANPGAELDILSLDAWDDPRATAEGPLIPSAGQRFAVVDEHGVHGVVAIRGPHPGDCDHCWGAQLAIDVVAGELPDNAIAVGPIAGPPPRSARVIRQPYQATGRTWHAVLGLDLDGDDQVDLETVQRCGSWTPSGCADEVCDSWCRGVRAPGDAEPRAQACFGFIPDVDDCVP